MSKRWQAVLIVVLIITGAFLVFSRADNTSNKLYDAVAADSLTAVYEGEHQDSLDGSGNEAIHYFTGSDEIVNHNNVKLGGTCWQILRTTDTGGVKMIYNGPYDETNKCNTSRGNHKGIIGASGATKTLSSSYKYGDSFTYDEATGVFTLTNPITATWSDSTYQSLLGKYTCASSSNTCTTLYNVNRYKNSTTAYTASYTIGDTHYSQIGTSAFNADSYSIAMVGYMYNTDYPYNTKTMTSAEYLLSSTSLNTTYWYADSVTWGSPTASRYNLDNPYQVSSTTDYPNLVGKYTFRNTSQTFTKTSVYYIAAVNGSTMYGIQLTNFGNHTLADFNHTYTYGDSYTDNGDGTYTINNPTTINRSDWYTSYSNVENKYICKNATNNTCSDLWYTTATSNTSMTYINVIQNNYKYAKGFEYRLDPEDNTYKYFLNDDSVTFFNISDSTNKTSLNTHHYTCWNTTGKCTNISYIYYLDGAASYYIDLTEGKDIEDAKNEMLYNNDVNRYNSSMKGAIEAWYHQNMANYTDYLEDVIYCNDRSQSNESTNGWNPDGGSLTTSMHFKDYSSSNKTLKCNNATDQFTTTNTKATLRYPVGLATLPEMNLLNTNNARKTGQYYRLLSPTYFHIDALVRSVLSSGALDYGSGSVTDGSRPVVSLKPGTKYTTGDGSMNNPYVIEEMPKITTSVTNGTITETSRVEAGSNKTIKYKPNSGYVIDSILVDGVAVSTSDYKSRYTFTNVTTDHTIDVVYRQGTTADFDSGQNISTKMKRLANNSSSMTYDSADTAIHAIKKANSLPSGFTPSTENTISISTSQYPVYIFFDDSDGTMYYYSEADIIYLNSSSGNMFYNMQSLANIDGLAELDTSKVTYMFSMFYGCKSLTSINALADWDTSKVTSMPQMFNDCSVLSNISGLSDWDTSKVTDMNNMFIGCRSLANINAMADWNTSSVVNMRLMFSGCTSLTNIDGASDWDTSKVTRMEQMFQGCSVLSNINGASDWDTSKVTSMFNMFFDCSALTNINGASDWNTSQVTDMRQMFYDCNMANINALSNWDTSSVTNMSQMFSSCNGLTDIDGASSWDTSKVTNMSRMFSSCNGLTDIDGASDWDTSKVTDMREMFFGCSALTDINGASNWDTSSVTNISSILQGASKASGIFPILGNPTTYTNAFRNAATQSGSQITVIYNCIKTTNIDAIIATKASDSNVVKGSCITTSATFDTGNNVTVKMKNLANNSSSMTPSSTDTTIQAIKKASSLPNGFTPTAENTISSSTSEKPIYIYFDSTDGTMYYYSEADTLYLNEDCSNMFNGFRSLTDISGLAGVDASEVTNVNSFFALCSNLSDIDDLSDWDTSNITNMSSMFTGCSSLENIDGASDWDTSSVTNMSNMFNGCTLLEDINGASNWDTSNVTNTSIMFSNCPKASGTFPILGNPTTYYGMFSNSATDTGSQITVIYNCTETTNIDDIIATKSSTSNVVKGSCILTNVDVTVTNEIYGNMASVNKDFSYTVTVRDNNDVVVPELGTTFNLKNDESEVLSIPVGYSITVTQDSETGYETTVNDTNSRTITKTITDDDTITYKNTYNISPTTGIVTILTPYILLLILSILTTFGIVCARKRIE